ncbi:hypothetical protein AR158_C168L [Paramecium bursaria Chlorella virus AR158]|uniref:hypothetical protein n=1 Tax=Paramecium bursaria Chlorella virus AR158 TaxID=380598 RepID=UPI00015AA820|nr:hypothetical protein AR158_C168L [Paramecium bursaria Chlorella virus AR158]ABU43714.1 hypothetical protein AR158_C168L [Paramecium bursaria Chlorella virus AR158]
MQNHGKYVLKNGKKHSKMQQKKHCDSLMRPQWIRKICRTECCSVVNANLARRATTSFKHVHPTNL